MDRNSIVAALGRDRVVETIVQNIARRPLDDDLKDLCQIVYLNILTKVDEDKLRDLWDTGDIRFYVARVAKNELYQHRSAWDVQTQRFARRSVPLEQYKETK